MNSKPAVPPTSPRDAQIKAFESEPDQINNNVEAILEFYTREDEKISRSHARGHGLLLLPGQGPVYSTMCSLVGLFRFD